MYNHKANHQACIYRSVPPLTLDGVPINREGNKHVQFIKKMVYMARELER